MAKRETTKKKAASRKRAAKKKVTAGPAPEAQASIPRTAHVCFPFLDRELPAEFVGAVKELEQSLNLPVWLIVQDGPGESEWDVMSSDVRKVFFACRKVGLQRNQKVALLIDSRGGDARCAFEIARLFQKHRGGFVAVVPRRAKSAATLLCLGADKIILGEYGELGPIDVQITDPEREDRLSGLDEVQSLERLNAFALTAFDQAMFLLIKRTGMKVATLLPHVTRLVTAMTEPLFTGVDVVRYTQMSRWLKVGEEYAQRLLMRRFPGVQDRVR